MGVNSMATSEIPMRHPVTLLCSLLLEKNTHLCTYKVLHWQQEHTQKFRRDSTVIYEESHGITVLLYHSGMTKFAGRWLGKLLVLWVRDACEKEASVFSESRPCV